MSAGLGNGKMGPRYLVAVPSTKAGYIKFVSGGFLKLDSAQRCRKDKALPLSAIYLVEFGKVPERIEGDVFPPKEKP